MLPSLSGEPLRTRNAEPLIKIDKKRFVAYNLLAVALALGANFLGITSWLMSMNVDLFRTTLKADIIYPVNSLSRYIDSDHDYEFLYPAKWIKDPSVFLVRTVSYCNSLTAFTYSLQQCFLFIIRRETSCLCQLDKDRLTRRG